MKYLSLAGIIAITCAPLVLADNADKVILVNSSVLLVNAEYFDPKSIISKVEPGGNTRNSLHFAFTTIKTLPADTTNVYDIYRSDSGCCKYERVGGFNDSLCRDQNNKYDKYLSEDLQQVKRSSNCGKPMHYENEHAGTMQFWNLLTEKQLANRCFFLTNSVTSKIGVLYKERFEFDSTLKKNWYQRVKGVIVRKFNTCNRDSIN